MVAKLQIVPEGISLNFFLEQTYIPSEAYHPEASNFPYTFETMLPIIPDQWKSLFQFLPILGNSE